jgi:ABC-type nitrate/sulfonate/bicarbonate transport system permease component
MPRPPSPSHGDTGPRGTIAPTAARVDATGTPPPASNHRRVPAPDRVSRWGLPVAGVLGVLLLFETAPRVGLVNETYFPPASAMVAELGRRLADGAVWVSIGQTLQGWALGLGLAMLITIPLGILIGSVSLLFQSTRSVIEFLRPVPSVALVPLAVLVFGAGLESKVFLAAFAATWPLLMQTVYGVRDVDPVATETARSFGVPTTRRLLRVTLPSALPYIATGVRISSSVALILAVTAELVIGAPGLGLDINVARQGGAVEAMYALVILTGLLGWGLNELIHRVERGLLRWHPSHRGEAP